MFQQSESIKNLAVALCEFHANLTEPKNTKKVNAGRMNYSYIELPDLLNELRPQLAKQGLLLMQAPFTFDDQLGVETILLHKSGEFIKSAFATNCPSGGAQQVGSQITYYRRYAILSILALGQDDDDGAAATHRSLPNNGGAPATQSQKDLVKKLLGQDEYDAHKDFIENKMTASQADIRIKQLMGEKKNG
jgi:hypothetical protein